MQSETQCVAMASAININANGENANEGTQFNSNSLTFDPAIMKNLKEIPDEFVWPKEDRAGYEVAGEMMEVIPTVDLGAFMRGDEDAVKEALETIVKVYTDYGFFHVVNHGVSRDLIDAAHCHMDSFFGLPLSDKQRLGKRRVCERVGYFSSFTDRFASKLPWREILSLYYGPQSDVAEYFAKNMGSQFQEMGAVCKKYCEEMERVALEVTELLAMAMGVERKYYRTFFEGNNSVLRFNYYPPCQQPSITLGTGPHCDSNSLTLLHQDTVGGLEVLINDKWLPVPPNTDALIVNIGDTFTALSNGLFKSCKHRAVVNNTTHRKSIAFFLSPADHQVVRPPQRLLDGTRQPRKYADFTWPQFSEFTHKSYRSDINTLEAFNQWLTSTN